MQTAHDRVAADTEDFCCPNNLSCHAFFCMQPATPPSLRPSMHDIYMHTSQPFNTCNACTSYKVQQYKNTLYVAVSTTNDHLVLGRPLQAARPSLRSLVLVTVEFIERCVQTCVSVLFSDSIQCVVSVCDQAWDSLSCSFSTS